MNKRQKIKQLKKALEILNTIEITESDYDADGIIYINIKDIQSNLEKIKKVCGILGINKHQLIADMREYQDEVLKELDLSMIVWWINIPKGVGFYYGYKKRFFIKKYKLEYLDDWRIFEKVILSETDELPLCLEKEHLAKIAIMLKKEGFCPKEFRVCEVPIAGVYCIESIAKEQGVDYFMIHEVKGKLVPHYTTLKFNKKGVNTFPCSSIKKSIEKMEC